MSAGGPLDFRGTQAPMRTIPIAEVFYGPKTGYFGVSFQLSASERAATVSWWLQVKLPRRRGISKHRFDGRKLSLCSRRLCNASGYAR
jgi:hypothetical protein